MTSPMRPLLVAAASIVAMAATPAAAQSYYMRQKLVIGTGANAAQPTPSPTATPTPTPLASKVVASPSYMQLVSNAISNVTAFNTALGYYPSSFAQVEQAGYGKLPTSDGAGHSVYGYLWNPDGNDPLYTFSDGVSDADCRSFNSANGNGDVVLPVGGAKPAFGCVLLSDGRRMPYFLVQSASPSVAGYTGLIDNAAAGWSAYVKANHAEPGNVGQTASYAPGPFGSGAGEVYSYIWTPDGSPRLFTYSNGVPPTVCRAMNDAWGLGSVILRPPATAAKGCMLISDGRYMPYALVDPLTAAGGGVNNIYSSH